MADVSRRKVMVIGLDGLTLERLLPQVATGELPTFRRMLESGVSGKLSSVTNMATGPTWASFATGCLPPAHGILHDFYHGQDYTLTPAQGRHLAVPPFWQLASDAGRRVVVLNVPMSYPVAPVNGVILAGIDAPSERDGGFEHPAGTLRMLRRQGVDYIIDCGMASYMQRGDEVGAWRAVLRETEGRTRTAEVLLALHPDWDLFVTVYSLPDIWQHYYWTASPGSPGEAQIRRAHREMDAHLARLVALLPADGVVLLCSDHGFGPLHATRDVLNQWLVGQGLAAQRPETVSNDLLYRVRDLVRSRMSFRRRQQMLAAVPWLRRRVETELRVGLLDFDRTQVYAAVDHLDLWLNVAGRQQQGTVPAAAHAHFCEMVRARLLTWCDPETGRPYIADVLVNPDAGAHLPSAHFLPPDLRLVWHEDVVLPHAHVVITGDHESQGAYIVSGGSIPAGADADQSLIDVAPMVLDIIDVAVPTHVQGVTPKWLRGAP